MEIKPVGEKGHGLFAKELIKRGSFIIEYVGEILDEEDCARRQERYRNSRHFYLLKLTPHDTIDATRKGNQSRFINHACKPNAETRKWEVDGQLCVGIFAKVDIHPGTEITFDYGMERFGGKQQKCLCNSSNCSGYLGLRPSKEVDDDDSDSDCDDDVAMADDSSPIDGSDMDEWSDQLDPKAEFDAVGQSTRNLFRLLPRRPPLPPDFHTLSNAEAAARARPYLSFPRALRRALPARIMQIVAAVRQAQTLLSTSSPTSTLTATATATDAANSIDGSSNGISSSTPHPDPTLQPIPPSDLKRVMSFIRSTCKSQLPEVLYSHYMQIS